MPATKHGYLSPLHCRDVGGHGGRVDGGRRHPGRLDSHPQADEYVEGQIECGQADARRGGGHAAAEPRARGGEQCDGGQQPGLRVQHRAVAQGHSYEGAVEGESGRGERGWLTKQGHGRQECG